MVADVLFSAARSAVCYSTDLIAGRSEERLPICYHAYAGSVWRARGLCAMPFMKQASLHSIPRPPHQRRNGLAFPLRLLGQRLLGPV